IPREMRGPIAGNCALSRRLSRRRTSVHPIDSTTCAKRFLPIHTSALPINMKNLFIKLKVIALLLAFAILFAPVASTQTGGNLRFDRKLAKKEEDWVRKTLRSLTLDEKIGQMIIAEANVVFWNREGAEYKKLRHHIIDNKVGGVILFRSQVWPAAVVTNRWQEMAKVPLLISADLEMGPGMRLDDTPWWAPNMAVGATCDPKWARLQ